MAAVPKTVGTNARDYSTWTLWEADLDGASYAAGDDAVGNGYNDSVFNEALTINGGTTVGLNSVTMQGAVGQRHSGIIGTGCQFVQSSAKGITLSSNLTSGGMTVAWISFNFGGFSVTNTILSSLTSTTNEIKIRNNIIYNAAGPGGTGNVVSIVGNKVAITNNFIYGCLGGSGSGTYKGIAAPGSRIMNLSNNTVYNVGKVGTGACYGIGGADVSNYTAQNNIAVGNGGPTSGTKQDFETTSPATAVMSYNLSSDTSATGTGSLVSKTAGNQFVSTVGGSEDLHLKAGADAINAGTDLSTTPTNVNVDIDGYDRDATAVVWDIGADEYVAPSAGGLSSLRNRLKTLLRM